MTYAHTGSPYFPSMQIHARHLRITAAGMVYCHCGEGPRLFSVTRYQKCDQYPNRRGIAVLNDRQKGPEMVASTKGYYSSSLKSGAP